MIADLLFIALALLLLFGGAEALVRGSASLALRAGLSRLAVGLTVVAFGTSSPELVVSLEAVLSDQGDLSVGNAVGSNIFNIAVILGLTALICPIPVSRQIIKRDAPIALGAALLLWALLADGRLGRVDGALLFAGLLAYLGMNLALARRPAGATDPEAPEAGDADSGDADAGDADAGDADAGDEVGTMSRHWGIDLAFIAGGLGVLVFGSRLLVEHAVSLAHDFGISEAVIGLTIVAAGTSMPELATSLVAAIRRQSDIAIGNVIGSNVFNVLGILGTASLVAPIHAPNISLVDYATMIGLTVLIIPLLYTGRILHRIEGAVLLALYGVYLYAVWPK
ncbi:calcium/sodium antiporter [Alienimonas californiensis]|uniref:Inner membrane protein YrbG n=1 Tax=Alienimonas californiensis TaxID=2527989 RepID=A0A517P6A5_9PLAN|nr:calcium/sodium antiporter [Alienimonas californiensis]QDT14886.1 Inner membrane protein YrbG [Alienimonas californiensis]